jgi:uncharacterized protein (TIGR02145 family)
MLSDSRDGNAYKTITIGGKTWMAENLNYQTDHSWCYGGNDYGCPVCGRHYDWNAAMTACPPGWHLSTRQEWDELVEMAGGKRVAGKKLKSRDFWNGADEYGFSALPCGAYVTAGRFWYEAGKVGMWRTDVENNFVTMNNVADGRNNVYIMSDDGHGTRLETLAAFSVRCVQGAAPASAGGGGNEW